MEDILVITLEVLYFICAVLTALVYPREQAEQRHNLCYPSSGYKEHLTYGDIFRGFIIGLIPVLNAIYLFEVTAANLDKVKVFKKGIDREDYR